MIIKINDGFCEWTYNIEDLSNYSIADIVRIITENTNSSVVEKYLSKSNDVLEIEQRNALTRLLNDRSSR